MKKTLCAIWKFLKRANNDLTTTQMNWIGGVASVLSLGLGISSLFGNLSSDTYAVIGVLLSAVGCISIMAALVARLNYIAAVYVVMLLLLIVLLMQFFGLVSAR